MADEPCFPPPRTPGPAYREPAVLPVARPPAEARRVVEVSRPDPIVDPKPGPQRRPVPPLGQALREERSFWRKQQVFARYPRAVGLVLVGLGGWLAYSTVQTLLHGGYYGVRSAVAGPVLLLVGLWCAAFGYPLEQRSSPPAWWTAGFVACAASGFLMGLGLLGALMD